MRFRFSRELRNSITGIISNWRGSPMAAKARHVRRKAGMSEWSITSAIACTTSAESWSIGRFVDGNISLRWLEAFLLITAAVMAALALSG